MGDGQRPTTLEHRSGETRPPAPLGVQAPASNETICPADCVFVLVGPEDPIRQSDAEIGLAPRLDYRVIADSCDATLIEGFPPAARLRGPRVVRVLRSLSHNVLRAARLVRRAPSQSVVYSTAATWGLPIGLMCRVLGRDDIQHTVYAHRLYSRKWLNLLRRLGRVVHVSHWLCATEAQAALLRAVDLGGVDVTAVSQGVDTEFFFPQKSGEGSGRGYVLTVGTEMRNHSLLFSAVRHLSADVIVKASSLWMSSGRAPIVGTPSNVRVVTEHISFEELRTLYARAAVVVVPLYDTPQAAGITTILEAMAMAKCVVATRSQGLPDALVDGVTGVVVEPTPKALSAALERLLADPSTRARVGSSARDEVLKSHTLEHYAERTVGLIAAAPSRAE